ncbi:MAG: dihydropteroate synthase [SAR202 cluster bacterium]|nr:dihydropteroate synthase [SAR202 cluster bacterium]
MFYDLLIYTCLMKKSIWDSTTSIMGIINVTPDSFSGDGFGVDFDSAISQSLQFVNDGAALLMLVENQLALLIFMKMLGIFLF